MKKATIFLLLAALLFTAGCGAKQPEPTQAATVPVETTAPATEAPTEPPTEPVPDCVDAVVQVNKTPAILQLLNRGDIVDVVAEYDEEHYIIKTEAGYGLVEMQLLRMTGEPDYEVWSGYARGGAKLYSNYQLTGAVQATLNVNTAVAVLDELDHCYVVKVGDANGFISKDQVSKDYIFYRNDNSSGGGGGGSSGGGMDGGEITLRDFRFVPLSATPQQGAVTGSAKVLASGTPLILCYFDRDDTVSLVSEEGFAPSWEGYYTLYLDGMYAYLPETFILTEETPYEQWDGFSGYSAVLYDNYLLQGDGQYLSINSSVTVLWDAGTFYVVSVDGNLGYVKTGEIGHQRFVITGRGESSGGGGGGGGGAEWSPPAL